jgi:general secretion pathway protein D
LFLRPIVIRNEEQSAHVTADRYDYMRNEEQKVQPASAVLLPDMTAPVMPSLQNGKVGGNGLAQPLPDKAPQPVQPVQVQPAAPDNSNLPLIDLTTKPKQ